MAVALDRRGLTQYQCIIPQGHSHTIWCKYNTSSDDQSPHDFEERELNDG